MIELSAEAINLHSSYKVCAVANTIIDFVTDFGVEYRIDFMEDYSIWEENAYQLVIINKNKKASPNDEKLKHAIFCIIEEFFRANPSILLYICETGDGRQTARSRLFLRWFKNYEGATELYLQDAEIESEGIINYAALIIQRNNPDFNSIIETFNETISILQDKPE